MFPQFRRFRQPAATAPTPHKRSAEAPPSPHATPEPTPTSVAVGGHRYQLNWPEYLRRKAEDKRAEAADLNSEIQDLIARAARCCAEADDMERIATVVEADEAHTPPPDAVVKPGPAMATDELLNGEQPGFEADGRPEMKSTDPDTPHRWRVTYEPTNGESWGGEENGLTDADLERIAEEAGESAWVTYERELPWQEGRRHVARLDVPWQDGSGFTRFERVAESPLAPTSEAIAAGWDDALPETQDRSVADTLTMPAVGGVR